MVNPQAHTGISANYVPDWGHVVWLDFNPQLGHEQAGRRPALILSRAAYNDASSLAIVCPITNQAKGHRLEVTMPSGLPITGVVLPNHVKSLDWRACKASYACDLPRQQVLEVIGKIIALMR